MTIDILISLAAVRQCVIILINVNNNDDWNVVDTAGFQHEQREQSTEVRAQSIGAAGKIPRKEGGAG